MCVPAELLDQLSSRSLNSFESFWNIDPACAAHFEAGSRFEISSGVILEPFCETDDPAEIVGPRIAAALLDESVQIHLSRFTLTGPILRERGFQSDGRRQLLRKRTQQQSRNRKPPR